MELREFYVSVVRSGLMRALLRPRTLQALPLLYRTGLGGHALYLLFSRALPEKLALRSTGGALSYRELWSRIVVVTRVLRSLGLGPGSSATLLVGNRPEFLQLQAAAALVGVRLTLASTHSSPAELSYLLDDSRSHALIFESRFAEVVRRADDTPPTLVAVGGRVAGASSLEELVGLGSDGQADIAAAIGGGAIVQYTSGTTGRPKGAIRSHRAAALPALLGFLSVVPLRHDDVHLVCCPLYHSHGSGMATVSLALGGTVSLLDGFTPESFLDAVWSWKVTSTAVVPTMLADIVNFCDKRLLRRRLRSLRCIVSSGAPLSSRLRRVWSRALGRDLIYDMYGATELGWVTIARPEDARERPTSIGRAVPGTSVVILDERGAECPPGRIGEIFARSPLLFAGYHGLPRAVASGQWAGFCSVGDLGWRDVDGYYYLSGRKHEMIISGGVNVYPVEVEAVLLGCPGVADAAVVGLPDLRWGERVCAVVVLRQESMTAGEIQGFCRLRLGSPKVPKQIVIVERLPRTESGKILKGQVRELLRGRQQRSSRHGQVAEEAGVSE